MANQRIKANLIPSCDIYPVIHLAQYDMSDGTGKQVEIELYYGTDKFTIPSGASVTFRGTKRDKTGYSYAIEKFTDNVVTVDVRPQMTVLSGKHNAELRISKGETISNTIKFVMDIDSSALADDTKVSETDLSVIEKALQASDSAIQAKAEVEKLKESVEASEKNAKLSETNASSASASSSRSAQASAESANSASQSATNAQTSAESASTSATTASTKATEAQASAESAIQTKAEIEQLKKETIEQASTLTESAKQEISTVKDATVTEVTELKNSTVSEITTLKDSTIEAVTLLKDNAKAEADRATESSKSAKVQAEKAKASADSIANVTSDVEKLKEDLPNKITKFYASNQGETHITDSDNGKIQNMMIYGKLSQDGTPSIENPAEIKSVVNPTIKVCGKNLLPPNLRYNDKINVNFKKGTTITMISKNGTNAKGGNLMFILSDGTDYWLGFDTGTEKHQITFPKDTVSATYYFVEELSENYALYIGDENTYEPYKEQSMQLPITLNAIPVSSGGNVTIDGQQYISDRLFEKNGVFGIERNVLDALKNISNTSIEIDATSNNTNRFRIANIDILKNSLYECICNVLPYKIIWSLDEEGVYADSQYVILRINKSTSGEEEQTAKDWIKNNINKFHVYACLEDSKFEPLSSDVQEKLRSFTTYYPVTHITVYSEQLDGYTVFNYPISLANGWNYVKQQLNDNRDYIYDMDLQSAEAYVNSEYAVTLTELEV